MNKWIIIIIERNGDNKFLIDWYYWCKTNNSWERVLSFPWFFFLCTQLKKNKIRGLSENLIFSSTGIKINNKETNA